jgi:hypothetical protein
MANELEQHKAKDFTYSWVNSSRFLFYLQVTCLSAFLLGACYKLYNARYKGAPEVAVPESTQYTPKYK